MSTVVDATLFLLILGVAVATLVGVPMVTDGETTDAGAVDEAAIDRADALAELLATGTERVDYSLAPAARALDGDQPIEIGAGPPFARSAHGTVASLMADSAVATVAVDGEAISRGGQAFESAVVDATGRRIRARNYSAGVTAVWEPYSGAPIAGQVHAGERPPATADVKAASIRVDAPMPPRRHQAIEVADEHGFGGVASVVADAVVAGLFPPEQTRLALRGEYPVDALTARRYALTSAAFGGELGAPEAGTNVTAENRALTKVLADRLECDLRDRYATPVAAARNVSTGTVTVTVRTWSR